MPSCRVCAEARAAQTTASVRATRRASRVIRIVVELQHSISRQIAARMDEVDASWYFSTMPSHGTAGVQRVAFDRRKYGRHLLIDVGWVHDLRGFLVGE